MRTVTWVLVIAALAFGWGCARPDWIERTLVTVDVTGTWSGHVGGAGNPAVGGTLWFELKQQGSTVRGSMQYEGSAVGVGLPSSLRPIDGTVAGDVFRFRLQQSTVEGELTVSGDEMIGQVWITLGGLRPISLRRVDPSSRPRG